MLSERAKLELENTASNGSKEVVPHLFSDGRNFLELVKHAVSCPYKLGECPITECAYTQRILAYLSPAVAKKRKAVEEATFAAGAREVHLIEEPVAAAIGAGIDISKACGNMIVDIGGGTADIAVISLGGTVVNTSIKVAGDDFDEAIVRYMRKKHNLLIGERTAEDIKIKIGTTYPLVEEETMEVRGRNLVTGLPKTVTVTSSETEEALREATSQIVEAVISVLEQTPPELSADILDRGIVLTGGGAMLRGLEELIEEKTGINTMTAEDPMKVVAIGTGQFVEFMSGRKDF